ncbi:MAG: lactate racemase domain-containing protein [Nitrososphaerota archaeon]
MANELELLRKGLSPLYAPSSDRMRIAIPDIAWGDSRERVLEFPDGWSVNVYRMRAYDERPINAEDIIRALRSPVGSRPLRRLAEGREEVVVVFDDHTRPTRVMPIAEAILRELKLAGISPDHIRFIAATGAHGAMSRIDFSKKLGEEILEEYPVYNHNPFHGCDHIGETRHGTPVEVNGEYLSCDLKIAVGCILPHPMFGFGGGPKIILPGMASINAISHNHGSVGGYVAGAKPHPSTGWGSVESNILLEDAWDFAKISGLDFKVDVIINGFNDSTRIFCGDVMAKYRMGVECARTMYSSKVPEKYDVLVLNASSKSNEAVLALSAWGRCIKPGAIVIMIADDPRGQVTHYAYGKFGKRRGGTIFNPPGKLGHVGKLIVYSRYPEADPQLPIAAEKMEWIRDWGEVLEEAMSAAGRRDLRAAIIPNADIQCPEDALLRMR